MRDPVKKWGFIKTLRGTIFFHYSYGRRPLQAVNGELPELVVDVSLREPVVGDILVFEVTAGEKGPKTSVWAYEEDYHNALRPGPTGAKLPKPCDIFDSTEFKDVTDGVPGLINGIKQAASVLKLSREQVSVLLRNTPEGKKGRTLWEEFQRRQTKRNSDDYTPVVFFQEVLAAAQLPV